SPEPVFLAPFSAAALSRKGSATFLLTSAAAFARARARSGILGPKVLRSTFCSLLSTPSASPAWNNPSSFSLRLKAARFWLIASPSAWIVFSSSVLSSGSPAHAAAAAASAIIVPSSIVRIGLRLLSSATDSPYTNPLAAHPAAGSEGADRCVAARRSRSLTLVLEGHLHLGAVGEHLAIFELHVELGHLGDAEVAQRPRGALDRGPGSLLPGFGAGSDQLDDLVDALRH